MHDSIGLPQISHIASSWLWPLAEDTAGVQLSKLIWLYLTALDLVVSHSFINPKPGGALVSESVE